MYLLLQNLPTDLSLYLCLFSSGSCQCFLLQLWCRLWGGLLFNQPWWLLALSLWEWRQLYCKCPWRLAHTAHSSALQLLRCLYSLQEVYFIFPVGLVRLACLEEKCWAIGKTIAAIFFDTWMLHTKNFHSSCSLVLQTLAIFSVLMMASWRKCCSIGSCTYKNFFSCNYTQDLVNGYSCSCEVGWSGQRCEVNIDDCDPNQCQNEATCTVSCSYAIIPRISVLGM